MQKLNEAGVRRLWIAVLQQAVDDLHVSGLAEPAWYYLMHDYSTFAFDYAGVDAKAARMRLLARREKER